MKKLLIILCLMGMLWGCAKNNDSESSLPEETTGASITTESEYEVISEEQYYRLKRKDGGYSYEILDSRQNIVKSGGLYTKEPHISMLNETTVKVSYQAGTGLSTRWTLDLLGNLQNAT